MEEKVRTFCAIMLTLVVATRDEERHRSVVYIDKTSLNKFTLICRVLDTTRVATTIRHYYNLKAAPADRVMALPSIKTTDCSCRVVSPAICWCMGTSVQTEYSDGATSLLEEERC